MDATELLDLFRVEMRDQEQPYLFADGTVYAYINAAQVEFCRLTEGIEDGRSIKLNVVPGVEWYPLNKRILKLRKAYPTSTGRPVDIVNQERAEQGGIRFDGRPGPLKALVAGIEKGMLRAWPLPHEAVEVTLDVFRLPDPVGEGDPFEIDEQHHMALLYWAKRLAYDTQDADVFDRRKSEEYEAKFRAYCERARLEQTRARRQVGSVQYGGL
jgi:hypothetical protein